MYSQEFRARAVRLLADQINGPDGVAETRVTIDISAKLGVSRESLRRWYRQAQIDQGLAQGRSGEESAELRRLRKENAELHRTTGLSTTCGQAHAGTRLQQKREGQMVEFEAMSLERSVATVEAWANAPWPLAPEEGKAISSKLGWVQNPENSRFYFSSFKKGDGCESSVVIRDDKVWSVSFYLTTRIAAEELQTSGPCITELANGIVEQLSAGYGTPRRKETPRGAKLIEWTLPSGVTIDLAHNPRVLMVTVDSPARSGLLDDPKADPNSDE